jgi:hypothetical protein
LGLKKCSSTFEGGNIGFHFSWLDCPVCAKDINVKYLPEMKKKIIVAILVIVALALLAFVVEIVALNTHTKSVKTELKRDK